MENDIIRWHLSKPRICRAVGMLKQENTHLEISLKHHQPSPLSPEPEQDTNIMVHLTYGLAEADLDDNSSSRPILDYPGPSKTAGNSNAS
jgi:hypothetical protein